jgi:RHH-type proline utilization regulon transcriptional repressor/proline dehydrogenase/delta 1-pyrroline-5-carboxylate dehydrogenase
MTSDAARNTEVAAAGTVSAAQLQNAIDGLNGSDWALARDRSQRLAPVFGTVPAALDATPEEMPGPTGELNRLSCRPRGVVLCLGPDRASALKQAGIALSQGNAVVVVAPGAEQALSAATAAGIPVQGLDGLLQPSAMETVVGFEAIASAAGDSTLREYRVALARRDGALLPLITERNAPERFVIERHLCVDTTAAGGNASLIAASE